METGGSINSGPSVGEPNDSQSLVGRQAGSWRAVTQSPGWDERKH